MYAKANDLLKMSRSMAASKSNLRVIAILHQHAIAHSCVLATITNSNERSSSHRRQSTLDVSQGGRARWRPLQQWPRFVPLQRIPERTNKLNGFIFTQSQLDNLAWKLHQLREKGEQLKLPAKQTGLVDFVSLLNKTIPSLIGIRNATSMKSFRSQSQTNRSAVINL
ncbi:uncharacterized protein LOC118465703 [Anopheles albimanus]|uniref:Uncharacterized protein n=1 Tax=Anopheles albimanus TaxID=7167 RepID=A0A182FKQ0_ANOAL|nr:uncharacterized protein LOC118465703 [Anopheles albimanus]